MTASGDDCRDVCHCRPMRMPYMIKQTDVDEEDGARVLELMGELSDPVVRNAGDHREDC